MACEIKGTYDRTACKLVEKLRYLIGIFRDMECVGSIGFSDFIKSEEHKKSLCRILISGTKEIQRRLDYK